MLCRHLGILLAAGDLVLDLGRSAGTAVPFAFDHGGRSVAFTRAGTGAACKRPEGLQRRGVKHTLETEVLLDGPAL